jgi:LacI family repressor for deo operon, udp, cdd, tsx, nupC, and nupG
MTGIDEVARKAGVSISTASRAINGHVRVSDRTVRRVQEAALELGYVRSSSAYTLATGRNRNIGVVLPHVDRWYFGAVLSGVESRLIAAGYDLTLYNLNGGPDQREQIFADFLLRKRVDALLTIALKLTKDELLALEKLGKPVFSIGGPVETNPSLSIDDFGAARLATLHLASLGHSEIGFIGANTENEGDFHHPYNRRLGYQAAMQEAGLEVRPDRFMPADFTIPGGYAAAKKALSDPRILCTALVAVSDETAIGAILAARDLGMNVPADVSIVGIDGHDLSEFFGLTTVAQDPRGQGTTAAGLLLDLLDDTTSEKYMGTMWPIELIVRSSSARPPAAATR